jgi:hypothetical protein
MATTYLSRTSGTPTDSKKTTLSVWLKRSGLGTGTFFGGGADSNNMTFINFNPNGKIFLQSSSSGSNTLVFVTTQVFKDTSAWYNIIVAIDTTQGTASNRVKLYVNGVQVTAFDTETQPSQNLELEWNKSGKTLEIGKYLFQSTYSLYDGSMSYVSFVDGTQELPTVFGETDSTTGEWKIKTDITPSVAWGNNGFLILKNGNSLTDESSNSNNFTLGGGTLTETKDCPDNVFCVLNDLDTTRVLSNGNTTYAGDASGTVVKGTLGMLSGKYYAECKILSAAQNMIGVLSIAQAPTTVFVGASAVGWGLFGDGTLYNNSSATSNFSNSFSDNDIMGIALDMDNNKLYFSKNGVWQNSGDPTSGATGTGAVSITSGLTMTFSGGRDSASDTADFNFGNGTFGTTAIASAGTNASNNGVFEYDTPTGYTALSTKGLNL